MHTGYPEKSKYITKMWVNSNKENTKNWNFKYVSSDYRERKKCYNKNFLKPQEKQHEDNQHFICIKISVKKIVRLARFFTQCFACE